MAIVPTSIADANLGHIDAGIICAVLAGVSYYTGTGGRLDISQVVVASAGGDVLATCDTTAPSASR